MEKLDASRSGTGTVLWRGLFVALAAGLSGIWIYLARVDQESRSDNQSDIPGIEVYRSIDELVARGDGSVPQLVGRLTAENVATRRDAAMALGRIGAPAAAAIPTLQSLVEDENASVRAMALLALGRIGVNLEELAPLAALRLVDQDATVREAAAHMLIAAGSVSEPFALTTLRAVNPDARRKALLVLRHVAVDEGAVREGLTQLFNDSRVPDDLRDDCIDAGGRQPFRPGFAPYGYMSPIFKRFRDRKPPVRELIEEALSRIQSADQAQTRLEADPELRTHRGNLLENPALSLHAVAEVDGRRGGARGLGFSGAWARNVTYESDRPRSRFQIVRQPGLHRGRGGAASSPSPFDSPDRPRGVDRDADGISGASAHRMGRDPG